ncbi:MAG: hypothetical protein JWN10_2431 [Solirubrobacterales bacterium]|nr:hypothetical protein [Solirubrobacterales bacterium]
MAAYPYDGGRRARWGRQLIQWVHVETPGELVGEASGGAVEGRARRGAGSASSSSLWRHPAPPLCLFERFQALANQEWNHHKRRHRIGPPQNWRSVSLDEARSLNTLKLATTTSE